MVGSMVLSPARWVKSSARAGLALQEAILSRIRDGVRTARHHRWGRAREGTTMKPDPAVLILRAMKGGFDILCIESARPARMQAAAGG